MEEEWGSLFHAGRHAHLANSWPYVFASAATRLSDRGWRVYAARNGTSLQTAMLGCRSHLKIGGVKILIFEAGAEFVGDVLIDHAEGDVALSELLSEVLVHEGVPILQFGQLTEPAFVALRSCAERAGLGCTWGPAGYGYDWDATIDHDAMYRSLSAGRRQTVRRKSRRMSEAFTVELDVVSSRDLDVNLARFEDFLEVEDSGWKGREGSSIRQRPGNEEYFRKIVEEASRLGIMRWISLLADDRVVAIYMAMQTGRTLWVPKCAYHEEFSGHSPGTELVHRFNLSCIENPGIHTINWLGAAEWLDSWQPRRVPFTHMRVFGKSPLGRSLEWASRAQGGIRRYVTARGADDAARESRYL